MCRLTEIALPYLDTREKVAAAVGQINARANADGVRPLVFSTFVNPEFRLILGSVNALASGLLQYFYRPDGG